MSEGKPPCQTCKGQSPGIACGCYHCKDCDTYYSCYGFTSSNYSRFLESMKDIPITVWKEPVYSTGIIPVAGWNDDVEAKWMKETR